MKKHLVALFHHLPPSTRTAILLAIFSSLFVAILYALERRIGFNIADEGFLWYGAQRVMQGEVPIRDFMAYDLGRYYFCAAIMGLMGDDGILALRFATALFQCIGLFLALLVLVRAWQNANAFLVCLTSITLVLWMLPWQRLFDLTLSIVLITTLALVIEKPSSHRWFWAGLTLGVVAIFGRNHGVYGVTASLAALVYLAVVQRENSLLRSLSWWSAGLVSGYLPMFAALYFVPGLAHAFWESIAFLLQQKETNLPLPVPWPWRVPFENLSWRGAITPALLGCFFLALPLFCIFSVAFVVHSSIAKTKVNALFVATALLSAPYAHYAFSRADAEHLALGIFPLLMGFLVFPSSSNSKVTIATLLFVISLVTTLPFRPLWLSAREKNWQPVAVGRDQLTVHPSTASVVALLKTLEKQYSPNGRAFVVAPYAPGAYALLERKSPMWEIYALWPRKPAFEQAEIARIQAANPGFVVIWDRALDSHEDWRFRSTHPLLNDYIQQNFEAVATLSANAELQIFKSK